MKLTKELLEKIERENRKHWCYNPYTGRKQYRHRKWTKEDIEYLLELWARNMPVARISAILARGEAAIKTQVRKVYIGKIEHRNNQR